MNRKTQFFIAVTVASGASLVISCLFEEATTRPTITFVAFLLLSLLAATRKIHLPGITSTISLSFLFTLIAIALFPFSETVILASLGSVVQCLWRSRTRVKLVQVAFNIAVLALSSGGAYRLSHFIAGPAAHTTVLMILAGSFYLTADTLLVSGVLSLVENESLFAVWRRCYLWSFPYYLAGAAIAGLMVETNRSEGWLLSLVVLLPMGFIYVFYRLCVDRGAKMLSVVR